MLLYLIKMNRQNKFNKRKNLKCKSYSAFLLMIATAKDKHVERILYPNRLDTLPEKEQTLQQK